jgi:hypothetical protein
VNAICDVCYTTVDIEHATADADNVLLTTVFTGGAYSDRAAARCTGAYSDSCAELPSA